MTLKAKDPTDLLEAELAVQLAIVRALAPLDRLSRENVMKCIGHLIEADVLVPGVLNMMAGQP